ncbi:type II secretion system minor pseudopilin GspJ [Marinospirillum sp. MEB164]|uniref:Type II secretion system protein J n=1 Tax=Marinospirillum alkalitolerans TaxID=3123374 RepID=A0ABW8PY71_9GAMM
MSVMQKCHASQPDRPTEGVQQGFTLLEVLVALALLATLGVALTFLLTQVIDARDQLAQRRTQGVDQLVSFVQRVDRQLNQAVVRFPHEFGRPHQQALVVEQDSLQWVSAGQWVLPLQDYATRLRVWRLRWLAEEQQLRLESHGWLDLADAAPWQLVDQLDGVSEVEWTFFHQGAWQRNLPEELPRALRLQLTWQEAVYQRPILLPEWIVLRGPPVLDETP